MSKKHTQHASRHTFRRRLGYTQRQLTAWLDAQERVVREQAVPDKLVEEFDPLYNLQHPREQLHQVYERGQPNTQWVYEKTLMLYVKVILDRQPLLLGLGRLPDWLRNKPGLHSLDTYRDNLCIFRCIAVYRGAHVRYNMHRTRELAEAFFAQHPRLRNRLTDRHLPLLEKHFKQGIAAYTVQPNGDFVLTHLPANYDKVGRPVLTIGIYEGHAFLIRDIKLVSQDYTCGDCQARFTRADNLVRHASSRCSGGQTKINCPNKRIRVPASVYERAFYPDNRCSFIGTKWLEWKQSSGAFTFITHCAVMGVSDTSSTFPLMGITLQPTLSSGSTAASGTGASSATPLPTSARRWSELTGERQSRGKLPTVSLCNGPSIFATRSRRRLTPTRLSTTSSLTKTSTRQATRPAAFYSKASTYPSPYPSRTHSNLSLSISPLKTPTS